MIAGHFGLAAAVKSKVPQAPLWALMLATVWLDVVFVPLFLTGIETTEAAPGTRGGYGGLIIHADYTHSLLGALVLSALFGALAVPRWGRTVGATLGAVAFSHWLLDLIVHRGDMPMLPGNVASLPQAGFGLWRAPAAAALAELALVLAGSYLYWRAARRIVASSPAALRARADLAASLIFAAGVGVLLLDFTGILG